MSLGELFDLVIVGGGPGGLTAGIYAMRAALKTILIEKGVPGGQINLTENVENYPGFEHISGFDLSQKFLQHAQSYGLKIRQQEVEAVEPGLDYHTVRLANGELLNTHAVILAVGGSPKKLGIAGEMEYYGRGRLLLRHLRWLLFPGQDRGGGGRRRYRLGGGPLSRQDNAKSLSGPSAGRLPGQPDFAAAGAG